MHRSLSWHRVGALVALSGCLMILVAAGCSGGGYSGPSGTVDGKVTIAGQPAPAGCRLAFVSDKGFTAAGEVGSGGTYKLLTSGKPQIPVATYKVSVTPPPEATMSQDDYEKAMASGTTGTAAKKEVVPAKYQSPTTSELSFPVQAGKNTIAIELK